MRATHGLLLLTLLLIQSSAHAADPAPTREDTNREVIRTYANFYIEQKDYFTAESLLMNYLQTPGAVPIPKTSDAKDASLWLTLGQAQLELKHYEPACFALKKAADLQKSPDEKRFALYSVADCLNRAGKQGLSIVVLNQLSQSDGSGSSAALASAVNALNLMKKGRLKSGQALPVFARETRSPFRVSGAFGFGYQTNVLLIEDAVVSGVSPKDRGSFYANPAVQLGYLGKLWGDSFDSRYIASFTDYLNDAAKGYNSLYQRADFIWGSGNNRWGAFGDVLFLNRSPFQVYNWDGGLSYIHLLPVDDHHAWDFEIPLHYQKYPLDAALGADNVRDGVGVQLKARYRYMENDQRSFSARAILDQQFTSGKNYRQTGLSLPAIYTTDLPGTRKLHLIHNFSLEAAGQLYWESDVGRRDLGLRAATGIVRHFGAWLGSLDYSYFKNVSTLSTARYVNETISILVSHDFI